MRAAHDSALWREVAVRASYAFVWVTFGRSLIRSEFVLRPRDRKDRSSSGSRPECPLQGRPRSPQSLPSSRFGVNFAFVMNPARCESVFPFAHTSCGRGRPADRGQTQGQRAPRALEQYLHDAGMAHALRSAHGSDLQRISQITHRRQPPRYARLARRRCAGVANARCAAAPPQAPPAASARGCGRSCTVCPGMR